MEPGLEDLTEEEVVAFLGTPEQEAELEAFMQKRECPLCTEFH